MSQTLELANQVMQRADTLAMYSEMEKGIERRYGTPEMRAVLDIVGGWMRDAGMTVEPDAFGSIIGTYPAAPRSSEIRPFVIGGHLDSVRDAGRYDGILGVLTGLAVVQHLHDHGHQLPFPVQVIAFAEEEGLRFHSTLVGSRAWTGLPMREQLGYVDADGISLGEAICAFGGDPDALGKGVHPDILGFMETHIEQGPVLEREDLPVGVVTSIVGSERGQYTVTGIAGHAGTVPMEMRHDALPAASELVLAVEAVGRETPGLVATVGELEVLPGATNVIPGKVTLSCEVRHASGNTCREALALVRQRADEIAQTRGVDIAWREVAGYSVTLSDDNLVSLLRDAIHAEGTRPFSLVSGAGHDAVNISQVSPVVMLFVRCKDGISHNPAESVNVTDVEVAIRVMRTFLDRLARPK